MAARAMGQDMGRQPEVLYITPSKPNPWYGTIVKGQRFTAQQLDALWRRGIDEETVEALLVTRNATTRELWWPSSGLPPVFRFECPVIRREANGWVRVIAPIGDEVVVYGDGWTTPPAQDPADRRVGTGRGRR